jgi:hypothetical protein
LFNDERYKHVGIEVNDGLGSPEPDLNSSTADPFLFGRVQLRTIHLSCAARDVVTLKWPLNWGAREMTQVQLCMGISLIIISSTLPKADYS